MIFMNSSTGDSSTHALSRRDVTLLSGCTKLDRLISSNSLSPPPPPPSLSLPLVKGAGESSDARLVDYSVLYDQTVRATLWKEVSEE